MRKGQASLEQLLISGVILAFIALVFYFATTYASDNLRASQAKDSVDKIARTADYVYSLGPGSKQTIRVQLPEGVEAISFEGNRIYLRVSLSSGPEEVYAATNARVFGYLTQTSGLQDVPMTVTSNGVVLIGDNTLYCTPNEIVKSFVQGGSGSDSISIQSISLSNTSVSASQTGDISDILALFQPSSPLAPEASSSAGLSFSVSGSKPFGTYQGQVQISDAGSVQCIISVIVFVTDPSGPDTQGPAVTSLNTTPTGVNTTTPVTINAAATDFNLGNGTVMLCQAQIDGSGVWIDMTPTTTYNLMNVSVTYGAGLFSAGLHNVSVRCFDDSGNEGAISSYSFTVSGGGGDTQGPIVTNIVAFTTQTITPVSVTAIENDIATATCSASTTIFSWTSIYGTNCPAGNGTSCGSCIIGGVTCSVNYTNSICGDPCYGTLKYGQLNLTCGSSNQGFTTSTTIFANATGSDVTTGGSNISLCQLQLDGNGIWNNMNAIGTYNTSVTQNVNYTLGNLTNGTHTISIRCYDSMNNLGNISNYSFNVSSVDVTGPVVTTILASPTNRTTSVNISINATGSDSTTGNNNISMCQIQRDGNLTWVNMSAVGTAYGTSVTQNVTYSWGTLAAGQHNVSVRCIDSLGNNGTPSNYSFNVTQLDNVGPIVSNISFYPPSPNTGSSIRINATGNDTATGGSFISLCQLSLDGGAWNNMNAVGTYNTSIVQLTNYSLGTLSAGSHTVSVRCIDQPGNMGNASNITFSVSKKRKPILFVTQSAAPNTGEQLWLTWINTHSSGLGLNWSTVQVGRANVTGGNTNVSDYAIVVMPTAPNSDATLYAILNSYKAGGNYIVVLGSAMSSAISNLGVGTGAGSASNNQVNLVVRASHYVTSGYTVGTTYAFSTGNQRVDYHSASTMTNLASTTGGATRGVILVGSNVITYGPESPNLFNANGNAWATRILDFALNNSVGGTG